MHQFVGKVKSFNGRYWRETPVRVKASSFGYAVKLAANQAPRDKGKSIEGIVVELTRLPNTGGHNGDDHIRQDWKVH